jgi:hypothetical protein
VNDLYSRAEEALVSLEYRSRYDEKNRLELLAVHGIKGLALGLLIYHAGAPESWNTEFGAQAAFFLAAPAFFGGLLLLLGLTWNRNIFLEALGMIGLLTWDLLMVYVMVKQAATPYVPVIYLSMAALMLIHVKTLVRYLWSTWKVAHYEHA